VTKPLNLSIDRSSPVPLYHQVVQGIETAIRTGLLETGTRLDNEIDLAAQLNLSRPTMRKAMDELVRSGLLVRKRGVGTQVVSSRVSRPLELSSLYDDLTNSGSKPTTSVLSFSHSEADAATREVLQLPAGAKVYHFTPLRKVGGKPLALMENWVRDDVTHIGEAQLAEEGLYGILRNGGQLPAGFPADRRNGGQRVPSGPARDAARIGVGDHGAQGPRRHRPRG
jgi:DNA-binding GntR family transcriptional regulator